MIPIDITMPSTLRPSVLERTLVSFCENLFTERGRYRLIMNVDQIGEDCSPMDVVDVGRQFFPRVIYHIAEEPSFPKAFKWCWMQAETPFVFHMNEDWELLKPIDINQLVMLLVKNPELACMKLCGLDVPEGRPNLGCEYFVRDGFLVASRRDNQFGTNPELLRGRFVREARHYLLDDRNPEKQFRDTHPEMFQNVVMKWDYAIYARPGEPKSIQDIGRQWMEEQGFEESGLEFTTWNRKEAEKDAE